MASCVGFFFSGPGSVNFPSQGGRRRNHHCPEPNLATTLLILRTIHTRLPSSIICRLPMLRGRDRIDLAQPSTQLSDLPPSSPKPRRQHADVGRRHVSTAHPWRILSRLTTGGLLTEGNRMFCNLALPCGPSIIGHFFSSKAVCSTSTRPQPRATSQCGVTVLGPSVRVLEYVLRPFPGSPFCLVRLAPVPQNHTWTRLPREWAPPLGAGASQIPDLRYHRSHRQHVLNTTANEAWVGGE